MSDDLLVWLKGGAVAFVVALVVWDHRRIERKAKEGAAQREKPFPAKPIRNTTAGTNWIGGDPNDFFGGGGDGGGDGGH
jgi:hypothetical protein